MSIDLNRIYTLLGQHPKIRTVEIADEIDCDPDQVEPRLAADIAAGNVIVHKFTAPNGRAANGFEFSAAFKLSPAYAEIVAKAGAAIPGRLSAAVAAVSAKVCPAPTKCGEPLAKHPTSYAERAIAFIRSSGGRIDNDSLRQALRLGLGVSPSSFLRSPMQDGRLRREGRDWVLGAGVEMDWPAPAAFRCVRWSDGVLELQRDGETIVCLAPAEQRVIMAMLASAT